MAEYTRKDIHQTSTGVGHHFRPGYYFPSSNFQVNISDVVVNRKMLIPFLCAHYE